MLQKLQKITEHKTFIVFAMFIGISCLITSIMVGSLIGIVAGIAVLGIQIINMNAIDVEENIEIPGEIAKGQWRK